MPIFGPRLDAPSAIGDEGRPSGTSLGFAGAVVLGMGLLAGHTADVLDVGGMLATFAALVVVGMAFLQRDSLSRSVVGHLCFMPSAIIVIGALLGLFLNSPAPFEKPLLFAGFVVALVGVAATWADVDDEESLEGVASQSLVAYAYTLVGLVLSMCVVAVAYLGWLLVTSLLAGTEAGAAIAGLVVVVAATLAAVWLALRVIPVVQLAPVPDRPSIRLRADRAERWLRVGTVAGFVLAVGVSVVIEPINEAFGGGTSPLSIVAGVLSVPLALVAVVAVLATAVIATAQRLTRESGPTEQRRVAAAIAAGFYQLFVFVIFGPLLYYSSPLALSYILLVAIVGPVLVVVVLGALILLLRWSLVPNVATGPAVGATGLVVAALAAGAMDLPSVVVFGCVAGALVVWDVSTYGLGITAELGHRPDTRRLELFHGVAAVGVGLLSVAALRGLEFLRTGVVPPVGSKVAMAVAVVGVLLLLVPLQG